MRVVGFISQERTGFGEGFLALRSDGSDKRPIILERASLAMAPVSGGQRRVFSPQAMVSLQSEKAQWPRVAASYFFPPLPNDLIIAAPHDLYPSPRRCQINRVRLSAGLSSIFGTHISQHGHYNLTVSSIPADRFTTSIVATFQNLPTLYLWFKKPVWELVKIGTDSFLAGLVWWTLFLLLSNLFELNLWQWVLGTHTALRGRDWFCIFRVFQYFTSDGIHGPDPLASLEMVIRDTLWVFSFLTSFILILTSRVWAGLFFWSLFYCVVFGASCDLLIVPVLAIHPQLGLSAVRWLPRMWGFVKALGKVIWRVSWFLLGLFFFLKKHLISALVSLLGFPSLFTPHSINPLVKRSGRYKYTELNAEAREFRLLKLKKSFLGRGPICELATFQLSRAPPYDALSYTWDGQTMDQPVRFGTETINVMPNVKRVLESKASVLRTQWL